MQALPSQENQSVLAMSKALKTTVKGYGGHEVKSWRDLGREGHGREYANGSPFVRNGIFIQGHKTTATKEAGPGLPLDRRDRVENPMHKMRHEFIPAPVVCLHCHCLEEGHDRLMAKL